MTSKEKSRLTDEEYKFIFSRVVRLCLDFIIVKENKILLAKREIDPQKGKWSLPGGMIRYNETIDEAVKRIIKGELGLKLKEKKLVGYIESPGEINKDRVHVHSISMVFLTTIEKGKIIGSDQAHQIEFFASLPKDIFSVQGKVLKKHWEMLTK